MPPARTWVYCGTSQAAHYEQDNGHHAQIPAERKYRSRRWRHSRAAVTVVKLGDGWSAAKTDWCCEGYRLHDPTGCLRGLTQVRYGIVRAVDLERDGPLDRLGHPEWQPPPPLQRGQIVVQEPIRRPMAIEFEDVTERDVWLARAIAAIDDG
ncbi:MAG: hypothetical protein F4X36_06135 [Gammaproteobacteria bacterium]|nr:hypothetical protein [Gammaproteobacteria bacterium]